MIAGLSLERMDELFGVTELVKEIEADREAHGGIEPTEIKESGDGKTAHVEHVTPVDLR